MALTQDPVPASELPAELADGTSLESGVTILLRINCVERLLHTSHMHRQ